MLTALGVEMGESGIRGHPQLHNCFEVNLTYMSQKVWGSKVTQWENALATKPDDSSSIPKTHMVEREN